VIDESGKVHLAEQEVGWFKEDNTRPPIMYYIGHPNHWNTCSYDELVEELSERTGWPKDIVEWRLFFEEEFPIQNPEYPKAGPTGQTVYSEGEELEASGR